MTAGRMMTALGALALGLATAGAMPALAQQGGAATTGGTNTAPAAGATGTAHNPAEAGTTNPAPSNAPMATGQAAGATQGTSNGMNAQNAPQHPEHMNSKSSSAAMTHHPMEHRRVARRSSSHVSNANPNAQNSEIDRLNQESLQAAQQGKTFTPSGNM